MPLKDRLRSATWRFGDNRSRDSFPNATVPYVANEARQIAPGANKEQASFCALPPPSKPTLALVTQASTLNQATSASARPKCARRAATREGQHGSATPRNVIPSWKHIRTAPVCDENPALPTKHLCLLGNTAQRLLRSQPLQPAAAPSTFEIRPRLLVHKRPHRSSCLNHLLSTSHSPLY
jgi:hypothetical protein